MIDIIHHPCMNTEIDWQISSPTREHLRFGLLGIAGRSKGLDVFARLALRVEKQAAIAADFRLVGKLQANCQNVDLSGISGPRPFSKDWLSHELFEQELANIQYVVLPYNMDYYGLSASGVLLDVLRWRKPIVSFDTPVIRELTNRFGDIGYICGDENEMLATVNSLLSTFDQERYLSQQCNLDRAYRSRLPEATAIEYAQTQNAFGRTTMEVL
ncbi:glycosyltransferase family 1 protein [Noviherbaspirillum sedimenti]|uniref:Glycosyltransferase family 1 protein n=2 Tax=Noviherbaspirillum sedimenti TaxID=2320865 RepID=A0A3A3GI02_9BURK|nr:glycosyltransferase family 1 protein [Noviherbaspirillum sedimenti]